MTSPQFQAAAFRAVSLLLELIAFGMIAAWLWAGLRLLRGGRLPRVEPFGSPRPARWGPGTLLALVILYVASQGAASALYGGVAGVDLAEISGRYSEQLEERNAAPADAGRDRAEARRAAADATHLMSWNAAFNALFLAAFPWVFRRVSGASLADLGITRERFGGQMKVGLVAALLVTPAVYAIHATALKVFPPRLHPVQQMLEVEFSPVMAAVSLLSAVALAPLFEEILFRGVLQGWLVRVSVELFGGRRDEATPIEERSRAGVPGVILASALFAAVHVRQWPTPIPLFLLAMVMGMVRHRTGSLTAAVVIHALFNATSTLAMLAMQLGRAPDLAPAAIEGAIGWAVRFAAIFS